MTALTDQYRADTPLHDPELGEIDALRRRGRLEVHLFQRTNDTLSHDQIAVPLPNGRHDIPRRSLGTRGREDVFEGFLILIPQLALLKVTGTPFPALSPDRQCGPPTVLSALPSRYGERT